MEVKRGEVFYIENGTNTGNEQSGIRPAVVISNDKGNQYSNIVEVVYFTRKRKKFIPTHVYVKAHGLALCEQITTVSKDRLIRKKGECTDNDMLRINRAILISLGIGVDHGKTKEIQ